MKDVFRSLASVSGLGPHGEIAAPLDQLELSPESVARARALRPKVAVVLHTMASDWSRQQLAGIRAALEPFDASVVDVVECDFDVEKQIACLQELVQRPPHALISIPIDNVLTADAYRQVAEAGIKIVLMDNAPAGLLPGKHYASVVSADNFGNGQIAAQILSDYVPSGGEAGIVGYGLDFFVTNERELGFRKWMKEHRPDALLRHIEFAEPDAAGEVVAELLQEHAGIDGLFVVWDEPAMRVVETLRKLAREIPVTTIDLGNDAALEIARAGAIKGVGAQLPYEQGVAEAMATMMALVGEEPPPWIALPALAVTRANVLDAYEAVWRVPAPLEVQRAAAAPDGPDREP